MSRDTVLALLRASEGAFLSGEELSRRLGLSRTAIWKAVDALRKDGYDIEARTAMGYRLVAVPDALTELTAGLLLQNGVDRVVAAALRHSPGEYEVWTR